jgi:multicomponent Na+:H+ antiporter subunit D
MIHIQYPAIIVISPLISAFFISISGWLRKGICFYIALVSLTLSFLSSLLLLKVIITHGVVQYHLGGWPPPWGIAYYIDHLNGLMLVVVSGVALLNLIGSKRQVKEEFPEKIGAFYTLYILLVTGLLGIVITGDAFNLYVLLEIASLTGYGLISMGDEDRGPLSALNYLYLGTIGACFYLLGIGYLYIITGSLNMADISRILPDLYQSRALFTAFIICMTGIFLKMAIFPMHGWLPNAYTFASSPASSLVAPLVTKVMVYVMIRLMFSVFGVKFLFQVISSGEFIVWIGIASILFGAIMALSQKNIKRMFTYIIISEIGYMVGGAWLGNRISMSGSILHMLNDAIMTLGAFMFLGIIEQKGVGHDLDDVRGLTRKMPFTMGGFIICALSFIGVPPTCGFFSKWYLLLGSLKAGHMGFMVALILSSLVNVILFFRIIEVTYFQSGSDHAHNNHHAEEIQEAPLSALVPFLVVVSLLVAIGIMSGKIMQYIINPSIPKILG